MKNQEERQYQQIKGEYIGRMASVEMALSLLLVEYLNVNSYYSEFSQWFIEAPLPFSYKVKLLKKMEKDNVLIKANFPNFWKDLDELQKFRNILAHSFGSIGNMMTARGKLLPAKDISLKAIESKLVRLKKLEDTVNMMYVSELEGTIPPFSADDYADWPDYA